jgi:hypothetical protein
MTPKSQTMSAIMKLNPSVDEGFLTDFSDVQLEAYLGRLEDVAGKQVRGLPAQCPGTGQMLTSGAAAAMGI